MNNVISRKSNFELLRIVCMVLIIMQHYVLHGVGENIEDLNNTLRLFLRCLSFGGHIGVNCFMMITGYFMINSNAKIHKLIKLYAKIWIISILITTGLTISNVVDFSFIEFIKALLPITSGRYWFMTCYFLIYIMSPIINKAWCSLSIREQLFTLFVGFFVISVIPTITLEKIYYTWSYVGVLLWSYLFGAFYHLNSYRFISNKKLTRIIKRLALILVVVSLIFIWTNMYIVDEFQVSMVSYNYLTVINKVPVILCAIGIFVLFAQLDITSRIINIIAGSVLTVYLIHDNPLIRDFLWNQVFCTIKFVTTLFFLFHILVTIITLFLIAICVDKIFALLCWLFKIDDKTDHFIKILKVTGRKWAECIKMMIKDTNGIE